MIKIVKLPTQDNGLKPLLEKLSYLLLMAMLITKLPYLVLMRTFYLFCEKRQYFSIRFYLLKLSFEDA